jgi:hypothetical protein
MVSSVQNSAHNNDVGFFFLLLIFICDTQSQLLHFADPARQEACKKLGEGGECVNTPQNTYRKFCEFEERAAAIYFQFASHFSKDQNLSSFWLDMAMHEKQHAGLLDFCLRENLFTADLPDSTEIEKLVGFFESLENRAHDPGLTAEDAFSLAIRLEASEINAIYCHLTLPVHSSFYLLRRKIATSVPNHIDQLVEAARTFGVGETALEELNRIKEHCASQWQALK